MTWQRLLRIGRLRMRAVLHSEAFDTEANRELRFHFDQLVAEQVADGVPVDEAERHAHRTLGSMALFEDECRDQRRVAWIDDFRQDVVYGLRLLRRHPAFTTVAAGSLALGIGANAAVLGAFDALVRDGLDVPHAEELVAIQMAPHDSPGQAGHASLVEYAAFRDRSDVFDSIAASINWSSDFAPDGPGLPPDRLSGQLVTPGWLPMLGIEPAFGRTFTQAEAGFPVAPVIVISHAFWQRRFGGDPHILNKEVQVNGSPLTIVGVMPAAFRYQNPSIDFWLPLHVGLRPDAGARLFTVRARLKRGATLAQAQTELGAIAARLAIEDPANARGWDVRVRPLNEYLFGWARRPLLTLEAAVALVLLAACANVAALLLSRGSVRQREIALREALGASRGRIVRQFLTESVLLGIAGGILGIIVAAVALRFLVAMTTPPGSPALAAVGLNPYVLGVLTLFSIGTGLLCGLVPAGRRVLPPGVFVSTQLALALVLLIGAGLLTNSLVRLVRRDLNFDPAGLVQLEFNVPAGSYARRIGVYERFPYFNISPPPSQTLSRVLDRLRALPGAESVAGISSPPVNSFVLAEMDVHLDASRATTFQTAYFVATPNLFKTLRTPLVRGRDFNERDTVSSPWVAVVNETAARRFWPGEDPLGKPLRLDIVPEEMPRTVVGVVRDIPTRHAEPPQPVVYGSYLQQPARYRAPWAGLPGQMTFLVRSSGDPIALLRAARRAVAEIDPDRPLANASPVEARLSAAIGQFRQFVFLVTAFAVAATLLAAIGTYGVMSYAVGLRTREIGVRRALGAGRLAIIALVGRRAAVLVGAGLVAGLGGALALGRVIAPQLWGVTPTDPLTFASVSVLLVIVAAAACVVPVRRALSVDPTQALRYD